MSPSGTVPPRAPQKAYNCTFSLYLTGLKTETKNKTKPFGNAYFVIFHLQKQAATHPTIKKRRFVSAKVVMPQALCTFDIHNT